MCTLYVSPKQQEPSPTCNLERAGRYRWQEPTRTMINTVGWEPLRPETDPDIPAFPPTRSIPSFPSSSRRSNWARSTIRTLLALTSSTALADLPKLVCKHNATAGLWQWITYTCRTCKGEWERALWELCECGSITRDQPTDSYLFKILVYHERIHQWRAMA